MAKKTKNNRLKKQIKEAFILTLIICVIIYIVYIIIGLISSPAETFILKESTISSEESKVGYVIRDEKVIEKAESKVIKPIKNEGERVAAGNPIFKYYNVNEEEVTKQIETLNGQIQEAMLGQKDLFPGDIKAIETQIETQIDELRNENNMQDIIEYKSNISNYIVKKAKIAGSLSSAGAYINDLITKRNELEETLTKGTEYVCSDASGVVSYRIDGLEDKLKVDNLENITLDYLKSLDLTTGQIVSKTSNKAKVINNFECYLAVGFNSEIQNQAKIGQKVTLRLSNKEEVEAEIYKINENGKDTIVFFKITEGVENLINYRKISIEVIWWRYTGLIVPKSSIWYENGRSYIITKKNRNLDKILVDILKENDNYCLIDNYSTEKLIELGFSTEEINEMKTVKLYDEVIVDPDIENVTKILQQNDN